MTSFLPYTEETFESLRSFNSVDEMNQTINHVRSHYKEQLTPTAQKVFEVLTRYSCKYPGVSHLCQSSIAEMVGACREQVNRVCKLMVKLGIIKQYPLRRKNGDRRQTANAVVILPFGTANESDVTPECHTKKPSLKSNSNNTYETKIPVSQIGTKLSTQEIIKKGLASKLPLVVAELAPFFDADELFSIAGTIFKAKKAAAGSEHITLEEYETTYRNTLRGVISSYKRGTVKNLRAVIYAAIKRKTLRIKQIVDLEEVWGVNRGDFNHLISDF